MAALDSLDRVADDDASIFCPGHASLRLNDHGDPWSDLALAPRGDWEAYAHEYAH